VGAVDSKDELIGLSGQKVTGQGQGHSETMYGKKSLLKNLSGEGTPIDHLPPKTIWFVLRVCKHCVYSGVEHCL